MDVFRLSIAIICLLFTANFSFAAQKSITAAHLESTGTIKIKVGVVMKSGDIKYLPKVPFYLSSKPYSFIQLPLLDVFGKSCLNVTSYLETQGASSALVQWYKDKEQNWINAIKTTGKYKKDVELDAVSAGLSLGSYELLSRYSNIPEFKTILNILNESLSKCQNESSNPYYSAILCATGKEQDYYTQHVKEAIDQSSFSYLRPDNSYDHYWHQHYLEVNKQAREQLRKYIVASCTTNFDATCVIGPVKTGKYWLTNLVPAQAGRSLILWEKEVSISSGTKYLELSNDNEVSLKNYATDEHEYNEVSY